MTITLASILAANAAKVAAEQLEIETAEKNALLQGLATTTEELDGWIDMFNVILRDLGGVREKIRAIENSPTVSNELLAELEEQGDEVLDRIDYAMTMTALEGLAAEAATDCCQHFTFNLADGGHVGAFLGGLVGERGGEFVVPRQAAE